MGNTGKGGWVTVYWVLKRGNQYVLDIDSEGTALSPDFKEAALWDTRAQAQGALDNGPEKIRSSIKARKVILVEGV